MIGRQGRSVSLPPRMRRPDTLCGSSELFGFASRGCFTFAPRPIGTRDSRRQSVQLAALHGGVVKRLCSLPLLLLLLTSTGCVSMPAPFSRSAVQAPTDPVAAIYLIRHGWHTGLALRTCDLFVDEWPEAIRFHDAQFIEIGWGDEAFYRSRFMWPWVVAHAAFLPSRSAVHVAGIHESLETFFPDSQIMEIPVTADQLRSLCRFMHRSYAHDDRGVPHYLGPALYGRGGFYRSTGYYFLPNTCNVWTARALAAAKCPIAVPLCTTAQAVVWQTRGFGREIQKRSHVLPVIYPFVNFDRPTR